MHNPRVLFLDLLDLVSLVYVVEGARTLLVEDGKDLLMCGGL